MLDPAGDAKNTGRRLATCYERSVTLQLCETLKIKLLELVPECTITITRTAGESRTQEQRAQIANQRNADLFIHISCFADSGLKPTIALYYMCNQELTPYQKQPYALVPTQHAPALVYNRTEKWVNNLYKKLTSQSFYTITVPHAIPDARLTGLWIPAFTLEFGISHTIPWMHIVDILAETLTALIPAHDAP